MYNLNNLELGERVFATLEEARAAVDSQLQDKGFVLTIKHTRQIGWKTNFNIPNEDLLTPQSLTMATLSFQRAISGGSLGEGAAIATAMVPFLIAAILFSYFGLQRRAWQQGGSDK